MINEDKKENIYVIARSVSDAAIQNIGQQTLSRICKLAFSSLTNSTPVLKLLHAHRVSPKLLRNRRLNLFAIRINSLSLNHPSAIPLSQRERVKRQPAFTLAEVLITLGIVGIVAAMTMPALIENHQKRVVETRLQKFYTVFNSALRSSVAENGDMSTWTFPLNYYDYAGSESFFDTYLKKYLIYKKTRTNVQTIWPTDGVEIYLNDGSSFVLSGTWVTYYPVAKKTLHAGVDVFVFEVIPSKNTMLPLSLHTIERYGQHIDWVDMVEYSCNPESRNAYNRVCATYIMLNGWKIPDNYPFSGLKNNNK